LRVPGRVLLADAARVQHGRRLDETRSFKLPEHLVEGLRRVAPLIHDLLDTRMHDAVVDTDEIEDEVVQAAGLDAPLRSAARIR